MPLAKCPDCGREVSTSAPSCPGCGRTLVVQAKGQAQPLALGCLGILVIFGVCTAIGKSGEESRAARNRDAFNEIANRPGPPEPPGWQVWAYRPLNVRATPSEKGKIVRKLARGESVRVVGSADTTSGWLAILSGPTGQDTAGYIPVRFTERAPLPPVNIESWTWYPDSDFAGRGAVIWSAVVRNNTGAYIEHVAVEITTFDKDGVIADTDFAYATGLPPGGTASVKGYATYYGTEKSANLRLK